jgi:hypothetical protein
LRHVCSFVFILSSIVLEKIMKKNILALSITAALVGLSGGAHADATSAPHGASVTLPNGGGGGSLPP